MSKQKMRGPMGGGPMGGMGRGGEKAKDFKKTMKTLAQYLKSYKLSIIMVIIFAIGSAAFSIVGPKVLGKATTEIFNGLVKKVTTTNAEGINFTRIGQIILFLVGLYLISVIFSLVQGWVISGVAQKVSYNMRKEISEKINRMPLRYFDTKTHGEVLSRVTNDVDTVSQTLNQSLSQILTSVTTLVGVLIMMFSINWIMTLASLIVIPISAGLIAFVVKKSQKYFKTQQEYLGYVNGQVEEVYSGHNVMKAFNAEEREINKFAQLNDTLYNSAWKSQFLSGMMMPIMTFVGNLGYVIVSILGGWLAIKKVIEVGDILSFVQYIRSFMQPIAQTAQIANVLQSTAAAAERVFEFLDEEEETLDIKNPVSTKEIVGKVDFQDVHFGYNPEKTIINDFTAHIKPGQRVAIVGPTGAGKTTMVKLLMRFYDVNDGAILIDGHNIKDFKRNDLRKMFGMVLQDTWLFNGTIMENLRYGRLDATDEEVINAAKAVNAHEFIMKLENGYKTEVNERGSRLSLGQRQLVSFARALLANPRILILDEATSNIDTVTEKLVQKGIEKLLHGRTSFVVAHRLSTIRDCDKIMVINNGKIEEEGNHEELLKLRGNYYELYMAQYNFMNQ